MHAIRTSTLFVSLLIVNNSLFAATIRVPQDQSSIQNAIALSLDSDTVLVSNGIYSENLTLLGKSIVLISSSGADSTFLQSAQTGTALLTANGDIDSSASVQGFTFFNSSATHIVELRDGSRLNLSHNRFTQLIGYETIVFCYNSNPSIERNVFSGNSVGHACVGVFINDSKARIVNNTFHDNSRGFYCLSGLAIAKNNIVTNSGAYGIHGTFAELTYNDVWGNAINYDGGAVPGTGSFSLDPLFADTTSQALRLSIGSPCINAGDPNTLFNDPDGTRNDIGALPYTQQGPTLFVPEDFQSIQAAIDALVEAKTISVASGAYYENLDSRGKWFNLIGRDGADSTFIYPLNSMVSLLTFRTLFETIEHSSPDDTLQIVGLTFRDSRSDTAINVGDSENYFPTSVHFENCRFVANGRTDSSITIGLANSVQSLLTACDFEDNLGTCIDDFNPYSEFFLRSSRFIRNTGRRLISVGDQNVEIDSNIFSQNNATILDLECTESKVRFNRFHKNIAPTLYDGNTDYFADRVFSSNFLDSNVTTQNIIHLWLDMHGEWIRCIDNVFIDNEIGGAIFLQPGEGLQFEGNLVRNNHFGNSDGIVAGWYDCLRYSVTKNIIVENDNTIGLALIDGAAPSCYFYVHTNDSWGNELGNFGGDVDSSVNISTNPLFCDASNSNFTLAAQSPAIGMGPFGIGCSAAPNIESLLIENQQIEHLTSSQPKVIWNSVDIFGSMSTFFEIAVGTDSDWQFAEMWNPATFSSSDAFVVYNGAPLIDGQTYYLRLRVSNNFGWSDWAEMTFRMNSLPTIPNLVSPASDTTANSTQPTLVVNNSSDAESDSLYYNFEIAIDSAMTNPHAIIKKQDPAATTSVMIDIVPVENDRYFWRVKASDYYEESAYSTIRSFYVNASNSAPNTFSLTAPANLYTPPLATKTPTLQWTQSIDPDPFDVVSYSLQLALDSNFSFAHITPAITGTQFTIIDPLTSGTRYWWKVKANDLNDGETWASQTFQFRTMKVGDNDANGIINITDIVYIINYIFANGPLPIPPQAGDVNCDGRFNITDAVYLINYMFADGPQPCEI